ncbi:MAG: DNA-processing protein DprA [Prosthecobacter sp.]|uniref:DNA-processing protein DprA n=1 Tax=Prosthecobacter sp. TaxID=1965333 RepID=UPI003BB1D89F
MIEPLTPNTQAILLLTAPLIAGRSETSCDLLSLGEYNRLALILRQKQRQPADLIAPDAKELIETCSQPFGRERLNALLSRGFLLSQAVERWNARSIWVISRADSKYPKRLKSRLKEDTPPLLYGCGDVALLEKGGLAVVGSRHVDDELIRYTENVGRISAEAHRSIVSGGARGIDRAAMHGALVAGGEVAVVMADSLEKAALARDNRSPLMDGRLVLISPYDPAAGFNVGHAMQRNKLIYALADAALVVTSDFEKGGTWAGAVEQLDRLRFVPVFVRNGANSGKGNSALLNRGGKAWPNPQSGSELGWALVAAAAAVIAEPKQETLPLTLREEPPVYDAAPEIEPVAAVTETLEPTAADTKPSPEEELLNAVRKILCRELADARTEDEVAALLAITKPQAKSWLAQLVQKGVIEKVKKSKQVGFRTVAKSDSLI